MDISYKNLSTFSIFDSYPKHLKQKLLTRCFNAGRDDIVLDRCCGAMIGLAYGDFIGAPVEFLPAENSSSVVQLVHTVKDTKVITSLKYSDLRGFDGMKPGQWTDDTSMGLCMADSLILKKKFDGTDMRLRFWNWWHCGYNNAFRFDEQQHSVGLGGNISKSLIFSMGEIPGPIFTPKTGHNDSGNGSIMRLAPVPIYYHRKPFDIVRKYAELSSRTTHPGNDAAEACAFMSYLIVNAINRTHNYTHKKLTPIQFFLESMASSFHTTNANLQKLLEGMQTKKSTEYSWNWREPEIKIVETLENRGNKYDGFPVSRGYYGSYCMDGLAVALNALYNTSTFDQAVLKTVNMLGDADSTGSICGQIAGAFYGFSTTNPHFYQLLKQWDNDEILLRAVILYDESTN